jgi:hypothetical protein
MQLQTAFVWNPSIGLLADMTLKNQEKVIDLKILHIAAEDGGGPADVPADDGPVPADHQPTPAENAWNELESIVHPSK